MKVLLNAYDSASKHSGPFPNLAIMKLSKYHKKKGDKVALIGKGLTRQDNMSDPERVYISCIFSDNRSQALGTRWMYPDSDFHIGGSGIDLDLILDHKVESVSPDYELYNDRGVIGWPFAMGFSTRGCDRTCKFCIVNRKEGFLKQATPLEKLIQDHNKLLLLDNNLTMDPLIIDKLKLLKDWGGLVNISQGLDARVIVKKPNILPFLVDINFTSRKFDNRLITFAYDSPKYASIIEKCTSLLSSNGFHLRNEVQFFVLVNYDTTFDEDLQRALHLKELGTNPFIMVYDKKHAPTKIKKLQRWCNLRKAFWSMDFEKFVETKK